MEAKFVRVGTVEDVQKKGVVVIHGMDRPIAVFAHDGTVSACDNRCPHLGFPLDKGTVKDGILTCHWHQARFDMCSGCTFDLWADDVPSYETRIEDGVVFVSATPRLKTDSAYYLKRLQKGMDQNIGLLQAKSLIGLLKLGIGPIDVTREIARYAMRNQDAPGGITELAIAGSIHGVLSQETTYHLLFRGARRIAETARNSKRQIREGLSGEGYDFQTLKSWFYKWVQGRDREGSERVLLTAIENGCEPSQLADMIFGAISNRVYADQGHTFDFANKAFELLDLIGWKHAADLLPLALPGIVSSRGAEELASWHHPVEIIEPLLAAERELPRILREGKGKSWSDDGTLVPILLGEDPLKIISAINAALSAGAAPTEISKRIAYAAAMRLARFAKANEVGDWFNPQHTYTFVNAVHQAIKRSPTPDVVRAVYHAALSVYMDRFLNVPAAKLPGEGKALDSLPTDAKQLRELLLKELNEQSRIDDAARVVSRYIRLHHPIEPLFDTLAFATVREDLDFHTLQVLEAGIQQYREWKDQPEAEHILVGVARDLAAVCPTPRARLRTAVTALKLHHGEKIYEDEAETV